MSSPSSSRSTTTALVVTGAVVGSVITLTVPWLLSQFCLKTPKRHQDSSITTDAPPTKSTTPTPATAPPASNRQGTTSSSSSSQLPLELREEQLSRHYLYFGNDGMAQLQRCSVAVIGVGGVGSHAAHMLARSGIRHLRLIDFDQVTLSSLNRHACATLADVGTPKAICCQRFFQQIIGSGGDGPNDDSTYCHVEAVLAMYTSETGPSLLEDVKHWDFVIDAIDDVPTKAALLRHCLEKNWRVMSCMGAGGKSDVTRLHISDLRSASRDPLASKLRQALKQQQKVVEQKEQNEQLQNGDGDDNDSPVDKVEDDDDKDDDTNTGKISYLDDMKRLAVVYSSEKPVVKLAELTKEQEQEGIHHYGAVDGMRIRILPVLGTMPAIMGQAMAGWCLCELGKRSFLPVPTERVSRAVRNRTYQRLKRREDQMTKRILSGASVAAKTTNEETKHNHDTTTTTATTTPSPTTATKDSQQGQFVQGQWVGPLQIDSDDVEFMLELWRNRCAVTGNRLGTVLELARWDLTKPSTCDNLVLLGAGAMQQLDKYGTSKLSSAIIQAIEERLQSCRQFHD